MLLLVIVFLGGLIIFHLLEPLNPISRAYRPGVTRRGYVADVIHTIVNGPGLDGLTKLLAVYLVTILPPQVQLVSKLPWGWQFAIFFVVSDCGRYWLHRWYHESDLLWRIHRVHHTITEMDALSVFRMHILEAVIKNGLFTLPFKLLGLSDSVIIAYSCIDILKGFWHHANLRTYIGPLNYLFNSAELHWWHHSVEARGQRANYGSILSIWDWLFGTAYWPRGQWPDRIGVEGMDHFPNDYVGQFCSIAQDDAALLTKAQKAPATLTPSPVPPRDRQCNETLGATGAT